MELTICVVAAAQMTEARRSAGARVLRRCAHFGCSAIVEERHGGLGWWQGLGADGRSLLFVLCCGAHAAQGQGQGGARLAGSARADPRDLYRTHAGAHSGLICSCSRAPHLPLLLACA